MTTVLVEAPVQTPEEERAARRDTLQRLYNVTPHFTPLPPLDDLFAIEEAIHRYFVEHMSPRDLTNSLETMVREHPFLNNSVGDETLIARFVKIAKGEINFPSPN